jgi:hypothetical protein
VPRQLWIVLAALAVATSSFAKEAAPKGAVHSWSSEKAEPSVVPAGEPDIVPRSALSSDFPMIDTPAPAPVAPAATKPSAARANLDADVPEDKLAAVVESPAVLEPPAVDSPAVVESPAAVQQAALAEPGPYGAPPSPVEPASDFVPAQARVPAAAEMPAAVVEEPAADAPGQAKPDVVAKPGVSKRAPLPEVVRPRIPTGAAEKAAARAYLAAMQARPDPFELKSASSAATDSASTSSPATPGTGVLPPRIIDVEGAHPYGAPARRTADRETLMREFPDELVERMWLQDWTDLERAYQFGQLVDVPSDPDGRGIVLRLEGGSRIGELEDDAYKQTLLCRLTKPALGLLYRIASRLRQIEGADYVPLEITSLVRTWDYQLRLTDVNPNADRTRDGVPPTHVLGMAFDIARTKMSYERQQRVEDLFEELSEAGELAYYKEGSSNGLMHYHVMALPSAETQLARYFERDAPFREQAAAVVYGERARLPEAPCVTFGSSLEPFSAICSCELPLEVSAATAGVPGASSAPMPGAASAPISR